MYSSTPINTMEKLNKILSNEIKFQRITRNLGEIKRELTRITERVNTIRSAERLPMVTGPYKRGNPLRLIISQIPSPTYAVAKALNTILTHSYPFEIQLEFICRIPSGVKGSPKLGIIASLDVEGLFTNVPVDETIEMILEKIYKGDHNESLDIPKESLKKLFQICMKEALH